MRTLIYLIKILRKVFKGGGAGAGGFFKKHLPPHKKPSNLQTNLSLTKIKNGDNIKLTKMKGIFENDSCKS